MTEMEIPCPRCGKPQTFCFHESINVHEHPEIKEHVLDGSVFDMLCSECGKVSRIGYPMLYHDPDKHLMLFMLDPDDKETAIRAMNHLITIPAVQEAAGRYMIRAVSQPPHLAEKILIRDEDLDDRTVELMKFFLSVDHKAETGKLPDDVVMIRTDELQFFMMSDPDGMPDLFNFQREFYDSLRDQYGSFFPVSREENLFIDQDWALKFISPSDVLH